jgi:Flp pilus assembly protein TadB
VTVLLIGLLTFLGVWLAASAPAHSRLERGTGRGLGSVHRRSLSLAGVLADARARGAVCATGTAFAGWALSGPIVGALGFLAGIVMAAWIGRLEPPDAARTRQQIAQDLPLVIDLLSACALVGRPTDSALAVVSRAVGGPLAERFDGLGARLALGASPAAEWASLATDQQLAPLASTMTRALKSGAPVATGLGRLADDIRRERRTQSQIRARSVGVKAAGPLALCFLPAFMLIGVVPTVAGAFSRLLV